MSNKRRVTPSVLMDHARVLRAASILAKEPVTDPKVALANFMAQVITICIDNCQSLEDAEKLLTMMQNRVREAWAAKAS